jgi:hypothetical protein
MKKVYFVLSLILLSFFFSCKSAPETPPVNNLEETSPAVEISPEVSVPIEEPASITVPAIEPEYHDYPSNLVTLAEPEIEFPDESPYIEPSQTSGLLVVNLPEPSVVDLPVAEQVERPAEIPSNPNIEKDSLSETPAETQPSQITAAPEQKPIPEPPAFLRPAEPIEDSSIIREAIPVPVNPIPESSAKPLEENDAVVFSRTVRATAGQMIEVPFRGTGWVFLGELGSQRGLSYNSRRLDAEGQSFIFLAERPGTYILKFYKEDYIRDYILNDHVQVIIGEAAEPSGTGWFNPPSDWSSVIAEPRWPPIGSENLSGPTDLSQTPAEKPSQTAQNSSNSPNNNAANSNEGTPSQEAESAPDTSTENLSAMIPENAAPEEYIQKAQEEFDAGRIAQAISILEQFRQRYPSGSDEAFWLLGQFYEANSPSRDIRASLDYYRRLTEEYPQSRRYASAKARIAYLERYYMNIR